MRPRERSFAATLLIAPFVLASLSFSAADFGDSDAPSNLTLHEPIFIDGDGAFTAENGVVGGSGTADDPYLIEGWEINASGTNGIKILGTDRHFVIRDVLVHSETPHTLVKLDAVENGVLEDVTLAASRATKLWIDHSRGILIRNSTFSGGYASLIAYDVERIAVRANEMSSWARFGGGQHVTIVGNRIPTVDLGGIDRANVTGNELTSSGWNLILSHSTNAIVRDNTLRGAGLLLEGGNLQSFNTHVIAENVVQGNPLAYYRNCAGLTLDDITFAQLLVVNCDRVDIRNLQLKGVGIGLQLAFVKDATIQTSDFSDNSQTGIHLISVNNVTVATNEVSGNALSGIRMRSSANVTVVGNRVTGNGASVSLYWRYSAYWWKGGGVEVLNSHGVRVAENLLSDNVDGVQLVDSQDVSITSNNITTNREFGVWLGIFGCPFERWFCPLSSTTGISVSGNAVSRNRVGVGVFDVDGRVNLSDNWIAHHETGAELVYVPYFWPEWRGDYTNLSLFRNRFEDNKGGISVAAANVTVVSNRLDRGISLAPGRFGEHAIFYATHRLENNTVNGRPLHYGRDCSDARFRDVPVGQLILAACEGVTLEDLSVTGANEGIQIAFASNVTIKRSTVANHSAHGIRLVAVTNASLIENEVSDNGWHGIRLDRVRNASVLGNLLERNGGDASTVQPVSLNVTPVGGGLRLLRAWNVTVLLNKIVSNPAGVVVIDSAGVSMRRNQVERSAHVGLWIGPDCNYPYWGACREIDPPSDVLVSETVFWRNHVGIAVIENVERVAVLGNDIARNEVGVFLQVRSIPHPWGVSPSISNLGNNFVGNDVPAVDASLRDADWQGNAWDAGFPKGGNYWSTYAGVDQCSGRDQDVCPDPDGLGDSPFDIELEAQDHFPLMRPNATRNTPPSGSFEVSASPEGHLNAFVVDASSTRDLEDPLYRLEVRWDWENDGIWDTPWTDRKVAQHTYEEAGHNTIRLQVRDAGGLTAETTRVADGLAPTIEHTTPSNVSLLGGADINAVVTDLSGIQRVLLYYRGPGKQEFTTIPMDDLGNGTYRTRVALHEHDGHVEYFILAEDVHGNVVRNPDTGVYVLSAVLPEPISPLYRGVSVLVVFAGALLTFFAFQRFGRRILRKP